MKSVNSFGCNAILWSAQSSQSGLEAIQFLEKIGVKVQMINSNGHGVLHKSAQRGKKDVCDWIFGLMKKAPLLGSGGTDGKEKQQLNLLSMIAPDAENCCPSDLAGMEGHSDLAQWLVNQEKKVCFAALKEKNNQCIPSWLEKALHDAKHLANRSGLDGLWENGAAVKKIAAFIEKMKEEEVI